MQTGHHGVVAALEKWHTKTSVIVKGEHIAVGTLHDIDIAHKTFLLPTEPEGNFYPAKTRLRRNPAALAACDCLVKQLDFERLRDHLERFIDHVWAAIQAMIHDSRDARIRYSTPVHDCERSATCKR